MARLIYFTIDINPIPGFFKGMPTPAAALLVLSPIVIYEHALERFPGWIGFWGYVAAGMMVFCAIIMNVYPIRYIHIGRAMSRHAWLGRLAVIAVIFCVFTPYLGQISLGFMLLYLLSPLVTWRIHPDEAALGKKEP
jgi:phosphatidylserine synthase